MKTKPVTPYQRLKERANKFYQEVYHGEQKLYSYFPKASLSEVSSWDILGLYNTVIVANDLGYDVKLRAADRGLEVIFVKRPEMPELY